jgi:NAD(P)-dependent dehydrogenase (short-subunit alcohol dehydrogenase family)
VSGRNANGRVAVVTGGAAGIGQAFAERLAEDGHHVAIGDIGAADETLRLIEKAGGKGFAGQCDVSSPDSVRAFADQVEAELGPVDVLVNNAGIYPATAFLDMEWEEWQRVLSINLNSMYLTGQAFVPGMVRRGWGRVVSVSSTTFHSGIGMNTHYTASKGGVIGFSRSLAAEVGEHGVTVNTIAPGLVRTATTENAVGLVRHVGATASSQAHAGTCRSGRCPVVPGIRRLRLHHGPDTVCRWRMDAGMTRPEKERST